MIAYALLGLFAAQLLVLHQVSCAPAHNFLTCTKWYVEKECQVGSHQNLTSLFDDRNKMNWDYEAAFAEDLTCRCRSTANSKEYTWFALEKSGICFSGPGSLSDFQKAQQDQKLEVLDNCKGKVVQAITKNLKADGTYCFVGSFRVFYYEINHIGQAAPESAPEQGEEEILECTKVSDVILIVDVSGSIGKENFQLVRQFLSKFVDRFEFVGGSRLGIVAFDENCYVDQTWTASSGKTLPEIKNAIAAIKYSGGSTRTDKALTCAVQHIISNNQRVKVPETAIVLTDGACWNGDELLPLPVKILTDLGCKIMAIGVGTEVNDNELATITGNSNNTFHLASFKYLIEHAAKTLNKLLAKACVIAR